MIEFIIDVFLILADTIQLKKVRKQLKKKEKINKINELHHIFFY
ncbi:hypothetical protein CMA01_23100 [Carnobacterium maltaromaticum]|nr:hypothetical protein CMA01_23100 [Carnobacterium maltaromaticum]